MDLVKYAKKVWNRKWENKLKRKKIKNILKTQGKNVLNLVITL